MGTARPEKPGARFGIRARLLTLLIPGIVALLVFDSWSDLKALHTQVQSGYDRVMLEAASALQRSVAVDANGTLHVDETAAAVRSMFEAGAARHKHLHVGVLPLQGGGAEQTLMGDADLPPPPATAALRSREPQWYEAQYHGNPVRVAALRSEVRDGQGRPYRLLVQAAEGIGARQAAQADALRLALVRDTRMLVLVVVLVALGVTWSLRPLRELRRSVRARRGQAPQPLDVSGVPREVAPLVDAINEHVASYRALLDAQSQFLADASHQLRTPLAIMLTQAGVALRETDPQETRSTLRAMVGQLERAKRLSEQLLSLAHASEQAVPGEGDSLVDLDAIAREVVLQHLLLAHEKEQDLGWIGARETPGDEAMNASPAVPVRASAAELHEVLANLVHNAIVHTPVGGHITVRVSAADGQARAEVSDDGPGIAPGRRDAVFGRFRQASDEKGARNSGSGLGLAIARAYARRNGGDVVLADVETIDGEGPQKAAGLRAILQLPLARMPR